MIIRSLVYGYLGSAAAGLVVGAIGLSVGLAEETIIAIASPTGMLCGLLGLSLAWRSQVTTLVRAVAARRRR